MQESEIIKYGEDDRKKGLAITDNPYKGDEYATLWETGWRIANEELKDKGGKNEH